MRISDWSSDVCSSDLNGRHHTFAFGKLPGPKKLHHFMLQTNSMDDVGLAYDRFDAERAIVMTLGRHTNDHMVSFYGATPSGFAVEYGWGAREMQIGRASCRERVCQYV